MTPIRTFRLGDLGKIITGKTPLAANPEHFGTEIPFLTPTDIDGVARHVTTARFLSKAGARAFQRLLLPPQSVCCVCIGATIGKVCLTKGTAASNQQINSIIVDRNQHDARFVFYKLLTLTNMLRARAGGAATPIVNKSQFAELEVDLPERDVQTNIAEVLSAYDDLIENNTRRIAILEEMARRIFEEWFVHFRAPGCDGLPLIESPLGPIPQGWDVTRLDAVIDFDPPVRIENGIKPFVPMTSLSTTSMIIGDIEQRDGRSGSKFVNGDTLLARITPCLENGKTGFVDFLSDREVACGSTEFIVMRGHKVPPTFVQLLARSRRFRDHAVGSMSGATGRQRVRRESLGQFEIALSPNHILTHFDEAIGPTFRLARILADQSRNLRAQRDLLLPKLMSGEIDVSAMSSPLKEAAE